MSGFTHNTTTIQYGGFEDLGGVRVSGPQITDADSGGDGHMSGVLTFALGRCARTARPPRPSPERSTTAAPGTPRRIQISNGNAVGGVYVTSIDGGGGSARVRPETAPSPSVSECLALP